MLQALGHTCLIEPMLKLIEDAWNAPDLPRPSIYACNAAIAACARVGRLEEAMALYKDMVGPLPSMCSKMSSALACGVHCIDTCWEECFCLGRHGAA